MTVTNGNAKYLEFLDKDQPLFAGGNYEINVEHRLSAAPAPGVVGAASYAFTVSAPRFALNPQDVLGVFPPPGSLGDHSNVLPHIQFQRSTLPWERTPADGDGPWLALLVFYEGELQDPGNPPGSDPAKPRPWTLGDLQSTSSGSNQVWWTGLTLEKILGQNTGDPVSIIEVDAGLLGAIFPGPGTRKLLAHVRNNTDTPKTPSGKERAVIIANRLPMAGGSSIVHLVSLEGQDVNAAVSKAAAGDKVRLVSLYSWRFACTRSELSFTGLLLNLNRDSLQVTLSSNDQQLLYNNKIPDKLKAMFTNNAQLSMVQPFRTWLIQDGVRQFSLTLEPGPNLLLVQVFSPMGRFNAQPSKSQQPSTLPFGLQPDDLQSLNDNKIPGTLMKMLNIYYPLLTNNKAHLSTLEPYRRWKILHSGFTFDLTLEPGSAPRAGQVIEQMPGVLRLPRNENADAENYLKRGALGLRHRTRYGNRTVSWYHGPFVPGAPSTAQFDFPIQAAEEALQYDSSIDMWDVSYAAAWELGRLLTLQNKPVAAALYNWKRQHAQAKKLQEAEQLLMHLPLARIAAPDDPPPNVIAWFKDLASLRGVPFRYLVPDERMLPPESLRFFQVDPQWVACLLDGAFSVGRVLASDAASSKPFHPLPVSSEAPPSGFLLRSAVVSGWPDLLTDGITWDMQPATKAREEKLSANVLLCLFNEPISSVDFHLKPEALHFGLEGSNDLVQRTLRKANGNISTSTISVNFLAGGKRVVDWQDLKTQIEAKLPGLGFSQKAASSAVIAFEMIEEVEQVKFTVE